ncbi:MAG: DNA polymerase III subunit delta' [Gammaproteobacteria bacterium]
MSWSPKAWQQERWQQVQAAHAGGRLAHALLLAGPRGAGKNHFADGLARFLLCEAGGGKPCGQCRSCAQIAAGTHPNLMRLAPAEDKRDIAIDDVRDLLDRLRLSSHYGQAKIAIVSPADALNASGVNALLKTVEEPPPATHLMFVAERWRALPATLRSRCQILRFAPPRPWVPEAESAGDWSRALADACEGKMQALRVASGLKRDTAQQVLETWLHAVTGWLRALAEPGRGATTPRGLTAEGAGRLIDETLAALRALERNGSPTLLVESIMIRASQRG